jgi:hypothetical protein
MNLLDAYDAILAAAAPATRATRGADASGDPSPAEGAPAAAAPAAAAPAAKLAALRAAFETRTGAFTPDDAWFEARSRAFWDDAITRGSFGREVEATLEAPAREWIPRLERAHRGLFVVDGRLQSARILRDLWSGASFRVDDVDAGSSDALAVASAPFDARLVGSLAEGVLHVGMLPGAVFHSEEAIEPIAKVLEAARARGLETDDALDALLRMERSLRALTRMKAAYAYRPEGLATKSTRQA